MCCGWGCQVLKSGIEICMSEFLYRLLKGFVLYVGYSLGVLVFVLVEEEHDILSFKSTMMLHHNNLSVCLLCGLL